MKVAVVGAGAWGRNHIRTLQAMNALGAVIELAAPSREAVAKDYPSLAIYDSVESIEDTDIGAAVIVTPSPTHYELAKKLMLARKDVFVEKPMTLLVEHAEELVNLAEAEERILMVGHLLMHQPAVQWLRQSLRSGVIGKLHSIHQCRLGLGRARSSENALWNLGVHDVAVALYLVGASPVSLAVQGQRILQAGIEDDIYLHMRFGDEVETHLHCSWLWPEKERGMTIIGSEGMLRYNEMDQVVTLHKKTIDKELRNVDEGSEVVFKGSGEPLKLELQHFIDCVKNRQRPISDGQNGLDVMKVMQEAMRRLAQ